MRFNLRLDPPPGQTRPVAAVEAEDRLLGGIVDRIVSSG